MVLPVSADVRERYSKMILRGAPSQLLASLTRKRLLEVAVAVGLPVPSRARKKDILETFDGLSAAALDEALGSLRAVELRKLCRTLGLADSGRKEHLVDRLLGRQPTTSWRQMLYPEESWTPTLLPPPMQETPDAENKLQQKALESHLWEAANILRGTIDSSDYRHYILGLLFYKRLSDVWKEEYERRRLELGETTGTAVFHRFQIPSRFLWDEVCRGSSQGIGQRLNEALAGIEEANPKLKGLFQDVDFAHRERMPEDTLERLVRHFSQHRLGNADVQTDMLGSAYEYLIAQFADDAGKKGGEFYTPKRVVRLLVECLDPKGQMSVYDPACGSGGMLLEAVEYVKRYYKNEDPRDLELYGQERNLSTWRICLMNLFLHDIGEASIAQGDTLRSPQHLAQGAEGAENSLLRFDRVLANPPFSLKSWGHSAWSQGDAFGRDVYGSPPKHYGDLAFVQHMLASLKPDGMLGVVLPHGVLFRQGSEGSIRRGLLEDDLLEAVIGLPRNLFYGTSIPACIWILNRAKPEERRRKVLFVDGSQEMQPGKNQNRLSEANVARLRQAFRDFEDEEHFSRVVPLEEIVARDFNLHLPLYVMAPLEDAWVDIPKALAALRSLDEQARPLEAEVEALIQELVPS